MSWENGEKLVDKNDGLAKGLWVQTPPFILTNGSGECNKKQNFITGTKFYEFSALQITLGFIEPSVLIFDCSPQIPNSALPKQVVLSELTGAVNSRWMDRGHLLLSKTM